MKRKLSLLLVPMALLAGASVYAGAKNPSRPATAVTVNTTTRTAYGEMGQVTNSTNASEYLGCQLQGGGGTVIASCFARNAAGVSIVCSTTEENLVRSVQGFSSDTSLAFDWDASGGCTQIDVSVGSYFATRNHYTTP